MIYYVFKFLKIWSYFSYVTLFFSLIVMCSTYNIFKKTGKKSNLSFIPIYNLLELLDIVNMSKLYFILLILPVTNIFVIFLIMYRLSIVFHTKTGFTVGLIIFPVVFLPLLNLSGYLDNEEKEEEKDDVTDQMMPLLTEKEYEELNKVIDDTPKVDNVFKTEIKEQLDVPTFRANRIKYEEMVMPEIKEQEEIKRVEPVELKDIYENRFINTKVTEEDDSIEIVEL